MAQDSPAGFASEAPPKPTHDGWQERFVPADDGTRLYVRERPSEAPLCAVLCDGIACDGLIWRYLAERMATALPQSELMIVEAATHAVPIERREQVRDRILAFVKDRVMPQVGTTP